MKEECLLNLERAADVFITSERREPRRFEKAVLAVSMAIPPLRVQEETEAYEQVPNLDALIRFKTIISDLHRRVVKGDEDPDRRLSEIIMAMGYDHLANFFLGYYKKELYQELAPPTLNVFTSIRRKVGNFVREARSKLQKSLSSGAYKITYCRNCSSQAFIYPKMVQRSLEDLPDIQGECYLCAYKGRVRVCRSCEAPFFPLSSKPVKEGGIRHCPPCRRKEETKTKEQESGGN